GVAGRHDQGCTLALLRADCTEDVGGSGPLVPRCAWTGAALGPAAGDLVLLAAAGLVREPDFYRVAVKRPLARHCLRARGEVFLNSWIAPSAGAGCGGGADSLGYPWARSPRRGVFWAFVMGIPSKTLCARSITRQRPTPCPAGIGPLSIMPAMACR